MYALQNKLFKTRIIRLCFITIWWSFIAKYSLEVWLFLSLSAYVYDPTYIGPQYNKKTYMVGINMRYIRK